MNENILDMIGTFQDFLFGLYVGVQVGGVMLIVSLYMPSAIELVQDIINDMAHAFNSLMGKRRLPKMKNPPCPPQKWKRGKCFPPKSNPNPESGKRSKPN